MNALITGGTGFIGSRLALRCLQNGDSVSIYGQTNTEAEYANKKHIEAKGAKVIIGTMTDMEGLSKAVKDIDVVFHLAAVQHEMNIPDQVFHDVNVQGTMNILEASVAGGVKRFVHGSTIGVYGKLHDLIDETTPCNPDNIYGITKLNGEKTALSYSNRLPVVVIRIPETYGPGDRRLLKLFKTINKNIFFMIGSGKNLHHLIYIDDLIDGFLLAATHESAIGEVFVLSGSKAITTNEMVNTISSELETKGPLFRAPLKPFMVLATMMETTLRPLGIQPLLHRRRMDFFRKSYHFSSDKINKKLGFTSKTSFAEGVAKTARWYKHTGMLNGGGRSEIHKYERPVKLKVDRDLTAQIEPFDTFWEAPKDIEKGYDKFAKFYKRNYWPHIPADRNSRTLVISCGTGYMVDLLQKEGYTNVLGIDSDAKKIDYAVKRGLNCRLENAFPYLRDNKECYDIIFAEQEINHLTKTEIIKFVKLCQKNLKPGGALLMHSLNGANPITGPEALAQNFEHYNTFTSYSLEQILESAGFDRIRIFPLNLYIFYENPFNYVGMLLTFILHTLFRIGFIFYGKDNKIFSKKLGAVGFKR
jgi:nucleoside-diphosphate-sugar epimerase/2-polyprenyl-3-methyl-5-hydroxy-6-metoxy-1,4-benzoquinol methylase